MDIPQELRDALGDLIAAHQNHKRATQVFLASPVGGDPDDEKSRARDLEIAHMNVAQAGSNVATIAEALGIPPLVDDGEDDQGYPLADPDRERFGSDHGL